MMVPVRAATALGIDVKPHLQACAIDLDVAHTKDAWYPYDAAQALWFRLAEAARDPVFGLTVTELQNDDPASWGVIEYVARNSSSFGDALGRIARYGRLMQDGVTSQLRQEPAGSVFTYRVTELAQGPNRFAAEWAASAWVLRGRKHAGVDFAPLEVCFRHTAPADLSKYRRIFRCPVHFERPETSVLISHEHAKLPMIGADLTLLDVLDDHAKELVARLPAHSLDSQVRTYLTRALSTGGDSSLQAIAKALALSTRTLQRRLGEDGLSHREMVDQLRQELSVRMVTHTDLSNGEMAFLLGFAEATVFLRAFKRWTGGPPGDLRAKKGAP